MTPEASSDFTMTGSPSSATPSRASCNSTIDSERPYNRLVSIFVYLGDDCEGGETYFPNVAGVSAEADGEKFKRTDTGMGLLVKPKKGSAVLWMNLHRNGTGDKRLLHAGLPVKSGVKLGMNMFSVYFPDTPIVG